MKKTSILFLLLTANLVIAAPIQPMPVWNPYYARQVEQAKARSAPAIQPAPSQGNAQEQNINSRYRDTGISTHSTPGQKPKPSPR